LIDLFSLLACSDYNVVADDAPGTTPAVEVAGPVAIPGPGSAVQRGQQALLDGTASYDPDDDGAALAYRWDVIDAPDGSEVTLSDPTSATPGFTADTLGTYVVGLTVTDADGLESTNPAAVAIRVLPWVDLEVALTWDREVDADLHLLAPGGAYWGDGDCFFGDPTPDWGVPLDVTDDPALSADVDANGGPESIALAHPSEGVYSVLVTYWNERDQADTAVVPHLVVSGEGRVLFEGDGPPLAHAGRVWQAGTLDWTTLAWTADDTVTTHEALGGPAYNE
jgi:hypothetical protein